MVARSTTRSNQRPDTLMQDRKSARSTKTSCDARPDQCSEASCHSSGGRSRRQRSPVTVVVISSNGKDDRPVESLEVKAPVGWETGQIRTGGLATWQAVAVANRSSPEIRAPRETDCGIIGSAEPFD